MPHCLRISTCQPSMSHILLQIVHYPTTELESANLDHFLQFLIIQSETLPLRCNDLILLPRCIFIIPKIRPRRWLCCFHPFQYTAMISILSSWLSYHGNVYATYYLHIVEMSWIRWFKINSEQMKSRKRYIWRNPYLICNRNFWWLRSNLLVWWNREAE